MRVCPLTPEEISALTKLNLRLFIDRTVRVLAFPYTCPPEWRDLWRGILGR